MTARGGGRREGPSRARRGDPGAEPGPSGACGSEPPLQAAAPARGAVSGARGGAARGGRGGREAAAEAANRCLGRRLLVPEPNRAWDRSHPPGAGLCSGAREGPRPSQREPDRAPPLADGGRRDPSPGRGCGGCRVLTPPRRAGTGRGWGAGPLGRFLWPVPRALGPARSGHRARRRAGAAAHTGDGSAGGGCAGSVGTAGGRFLL